MIFCLVRLPGQACWNPRSCSSRANRFRRFSPPNSQALHPAFSSGASNVPRRGSGTAAPSSGSCSRDSGSSCRAWIQVELRDEGQHRHAARPGATSHRYGRRIAWRIGLRANQMDAKIVWPYGSTTRRRDVVQPTNAYLATTSPSHIPRQTFPRTPPRLRVARGTAGSRTATSPPLLACATRASPPSVEDRRPRTGSCSRASRRRASRLRGRWRSSGADST